MAFERVFAVSDWWDGPRSGLALLNGVPHYFESTFLDVDSGRNDEFLLWPVTDHELRLATEDWAIWRRWEQAFSEGRTTIETHPALPEDRVRHVQLQGFLHEARLTPRAGRDRTSALRARAAFIDSGEDNGHASLLVEWMPI